MTTPPHSELARITAGIRRVITRAALGLAASLFASVGALVTQAADYHVGPGQTFNSIGALPWTTFAPGDIVYIHWRAEPYREKILISNSGAPDRPIRIRGVPSETGLLPVIDGENASTSSQFKFPYPGTASRGLVVVSRSQDQVDGYKPKHIEIDGLELRNAAPIYTFLDEQGAATPYRPNASSVFVERGENISIINCIITGSGNGLFVASSDSEAFQARQILIQGNEIFGNGNANSDREHNLYTEAIGITFQFNRMRPLRAGALGNNLKDRSARTVVRYNWIEGGAQQLDLVDPEGSYTQALADPGYRSTFVYGNVFINEPTSASVVHYGGDSSVTDIYRKGTLHFYHNTVIFRSDQTLRWRVALLRLDTNDESADVRNNILYNLAASPGAPLSEMSLMQTYGQANLGVNWVSDGWLPARTGVPFEGTLTGTEFLLTGTDPGLASVATGDFSLKPGSVSVDKATARAAAVPEEFEVTQQYLPHARGAERVRTGTALDLGAFELGVSGPFLSMQRLPSGQRQIALRGPAGTYRLDVSTDFKLWRESATRTNTSDSIEFPLIEAGSLGLYRAVLLPPP